MSQTNEGYRKGLKAVGALCLLAGVIILIISLAGFIKQSLMQPLASIMIGAIFLAVGRGGVSEAK